MVTPAWQDKIMSQRLLTELASGNRQEFIQTYRTSHFLAVAVSTETPDLLDGLTLMCADERASHPVKALPFKTKAQRGVLSVPPRTNAAGFFDLLGSNCRVLEIGKRADVSAAFPDRISIGRAANKDIVLRDASVSKFHAWFGVDEAFTLFVVDADSTNHTKVGSRLLTPRSPEPVAPGTTIRFGAIDTLLMDADTLWRECHRTR
jgi:FHA domain-containing protein